MSKRVYTSHLIDFEQGGHPLTPVTRSDKQGGSTVMDLSLESKVADLSLSTGGLPVDTGGLPVGRSVRYITLGPGYDDFGLARVTNCCAAFSLPSEICPW